MITYDLGEAREVSAFYIEADANDTYELLGSGDGNENGYRVLGQFANVVSVGHGLRLRTLQIPKTTVRYLRVGEPSGDGYYSVAELAAYCEAPQPFPPRMNVAPATPAPAPPPLTTPPVTKTPEPAPAPAAGSTSASAALLAMTAVLAAAAWLYALQRLPRARRRKRRKGEDADDAAAVAQPTTPVDRALRVMFVASGCAALIYEIVWFHLLRLVIGASSLSIAIVLAAFMGGMFLGSLLFSRFVRPDGSPLRVYALLELGIGAFGLAMPLLLPAARLVYVGLIGYGPLGIALRGLVAAVLLLPPTARMGATPPAVARHCSPNAAGMSRLAELYAANTIGTVIGCLLSGFYLLAEGDVWVTTAVAAGLNFAIGVGMLRLAPKQSAASVGEGVIDDDDARAPTPLSLRPVLVATALSGLTALGAQVVWTRLLTLLFGATVYAFAIILAVFLAGIGSAIAAALLRRGARPLWSAKPMTSFRGAAGANDASSSIT